MRRRGFTLIELLVVIAIIAILAAILFPVFAKAREKARQSSCQSNSKQMGVAMLQYTQDFDETFPRTANGRIATQIHPSDPTFCYEAVYAPTPYMNSWAAVIMPYMKSLQIFKCPSNQWSSYGVAYGVPHFCDQNGVLTSFFPTQQPLARFTRPAETMMIGEKGAGGGEQYIMSDQYYCMRGDHNEGCNVTFIDGHVKWLRISTDNMPPPFLPANTGSASYRPHVDPGVLRNPF